MASGFWWHLKIRPSAWPKGARPTRKDPPRKDLICSGCPELFELDYFKIFLVGFRLHLSSECEIFHGQIIWMQMVTFAVTAGRHSKTKQGHQQTGGCDWEKEDALLREEPPSSLLTRSCLLSSSPDALVGAYLGTTNNRGHQNKKTVTRLMASLFPLQRGEGKSDCLWIYNILITDTNLIYQSLSCELGLHILFWLLILPTK